MEDDYAAPGASALWEYNLHYFDGLLAPEPSAVEKLAWIDEWLEAVPMGSSPAWDPYPTSRRIVNWVKFGLQSPTVLPEQAVSSLASQVRFLTGRLEYHLMANHLLANAVALTTAGLYFGDAEGDTWLRDGVELLVTELREQILSDGGHFERSPVYHSLILEDLFDLLNCAEAVGVALPEEVARAARDSARWLAEMTLSDGRVPLFNDGAYGVAMDPVPLAAYAKRMGIEVQATSEGLTVLKPSGYARYRRGRLDVVVDVGPPGPSYQPGHAHCDMLSLCVCWDGRPLFVDTGTSTYEAGERRMSERGTAAHNTVQIGDREQSEIWASFRLGRRARIAQLSWDEGEISAALVGFPPGWARHSRSFRFEGEGFELEDVVDVSGPCVGRFHLHPEVQVEHRAGEFDLGGGAVLSFDGGVNARLVPYEYAPEFNRRVPALCIEVEFEGRLGTRFTA